jgi:hypothetical protein
LLFLVRCRNTRQLGRDGNQLTLMARFVALQLRDKLLLLRTGPTELVDKKPRLFSSLLVIAQGAMSEERLLHERLFIQLPCLAGDPSQLFEARNAFL